jgi:hypothetical protein
MILQSLTLGPNLTDYSVSHVIGLTASALLSCRCHQHGTTEILERISSHFQEMCTMSDSCFLLCTMVISKESVDLRISILQIMKPNTFHRV